MSSDQVVPPVAGFPAAPIPATATAPLSAAMPVQPSPTPAAAQASPLLSLPAEVAAHGQALVSATEDWKALTTGAVVVGVPLETSLTSWGLVTSRVERSTGGLVAGSWLFAVPRDEWPQDTVVMLRVTGARTPEPGVTGPDGSAPFMQYQASVVGSFQRSADQVVFASELDCLLPASAYQIAVPSVEALTWIASYSIGDDRNLRVPLGVVRFSAARGADRDSGRGKAEVNIDVTDFIGRRTAVFGITRSGKSSTIKTLATAVRKHAAIERVSIGQIIFDPQGEYAAVNTQDGTALSQIGDSDGVRIYQASPSTDPRARRLLLNFFEPKHLQAVWSLATGAMGAEDGGGTLRSSAMAEPDRVAKPGAWQNWSRGMVALYGLLHRAGFDGAFPTEHGIFFSMAADGAGAYNTRMRQLGEPDMCLIQADGAPDYWFARTPAHCASVVEWVTDQVNTLREARRDDQENLVKHLEKLLDTDGGWDDLTMPFSKILAHSTIESSHGVPRGLAGLSEIRDMHDPLSKIDVLSEIWEDMQAGRLVIVDLSIGSEHVIRSIAERIIRYLLHEANHRFRTGLAPVRFQVIVEEAHNLFSHGRDATIDPWVRLAKESAKHGIGLMFATQEVTSIDRRILANTHNWVVAHLNSDYEANELSHYYEFDAHVASVLRNEEVGYIRLKTYSSPYIVPVQVHKFDAAAIEDARRAAGLAPLGWAEPPADDQYAAGV